MADKFELIRKEPVVEACQWQGPDINASLAIAAFMGEDWPRKGSWVGGRDSNSVKIVTLAFPDGQILGYNDWVLRYPAGEYVVLTQSQFCATYEPVVE